MSRLPQQPTPGEVPTPDDGLAPTRELTSLFALLRTADDGAQPGESAALAAFRSLIPVRPKRRTPAQWLIDSRARIAVFGGIGVLALGGGVAAAATGTLPGPAQGAAHALLGSIGVDVPGGDSGSHGNGTSDTAPGHTGAHPGPSSSAHPVHPAHPAHPSHPATPVHPSHPAHPATAHPHPTPTHPAHPTPAHPARPTPSHRPITPPATGHNSTSH